MGFLAKDRPNWVFYGYRPESTGGGEIEKARGEIS